MIMEILNARPREMSFKDYRTHLLEQKQFIKRVKLGRIRWASSGIPEMTYMGEDGKLSLVPRFLRWIVSPMGTYRRGMQLLTV